jgi:hypothetical protein
VSPDHYHASLRRAEFLAQDTLALRASEKSSVPAARVNDLQVGCEFAEELDHHRASPLIASVSVVKTGFFEPSTLVIPK